VSSDVQQALVVLCHPRPGSFNHAIAARAAEALRRRAGTVLERDLYAEGFDPLLTPAELATTRTGGGAADPQVRAQQEFLAASHSLVVVHPNWWGKPPAMMAGWMDRVLAPGVAYRLLSADAAPEPLLRLRHLVVLNTSDTPVSREVEVFGDPLEQIWGRCVAEYLPDALYLRHTFGPVGTSSADERRRWLGEVDDLVAGLP
jgi:NAD(P)H dehydrogenase (quinone)